MSKHIIKMYNKLDADINKAPSTKSMKTVPYGRGRLQALGTAT